jgi:hypothetical protein
VTTDEIIGRVREVFGIDERDQPETAEAAVAERAADPIRHLGETAVDAGRSDGSVALDRYL